MISLDSKFGRIAKKQLRDQYFVWLTTVDSHGIPLPRPVWFVWENDSFLIYSQAKTHKLKHIRANPQVSLHFNSEDAKGEQRIIIFAGEAKIDRKTPPAHKHRAYLKKYRAGIIDLNATPDQFGGEYSVAIRVTPTKLRGSE